jgi:DNA-binding SARP family transcriptional activator
MIKPNVVALHNTDIKKLIHIRCFGQFSLQIHGKHISMHAWKSPKVYQLFLLIAAEGGQDVSTSSICDMLWPSHDADHALQNLEFILRRLRKTLQEYLPSPLKANQVIQLQHGKISLNESYCSIDSKTIDRHMIQAKVLRQQRKHEQAYVIEQKIQNLLSGGFLSGEPELIAHHRYAWHSRLCNWIDQTTEHWKNEHHIHHATIIDLLDTGLDIDPCSERLLCQRMQVLHQAGYRSDAIRYYQSWASLLLQTFGLEPSPIAQQAYQAVRKLA